MKRDGESRLAAGLMAPALLLIGVFMVVPIGITTVYSFLEPARFGGVVWNFSPEAYIRILFERDIFDDTLVFSTDYIRIFLRSLFQAGLATVLCLIVGIPTAWFIATRPARQKTIWLMLVTIPYWVNLLVRTIALLLILRDEGPVNGALQASGLTAEPLPLAYNDFAVGLGLVYSFLPFMILPLYAAFERFDFRLLEAAYDLHASRVQAVFKVVLPVLRPGIVAGSLLVFIPGIGAFLAPAMLGQLRFDDEVLDWVREALHASHADERHEHEEAIKRLQAEHKRLGERISAMYVDKLDGKIGGDFFDKMAGEWREEQRRLQRDIDRHEEAEQSYMDEGIRILELARNAQALFERQPAREKRRLLNFVLSNCSWEDGEVVATFRQPFDLLAETTAIAARSSTGSGGKSAKSKIWLGR